MIFENKIIGLIGVFVFSIFYFFSSFALDIIPTGSDNNLLYYKMGGGSDFDLPAVNDTLNVDTGSQIYFRENLFFEYV